MDPTNRQFKKKLLKLLQEMENPIVYKVSAGGEPSSIWEKIPFITRFVRGSSDIANQSIQTNLAIKNIKTPTSVSSGFLFGALGLAIVDFLFIPALYLSSYIFNKKVPFTIDNNIKWGAATITLVLAIVAVAVPGAALVIGVLGAALALAFSVAILGKALYERYQLGREIRAVLEDTSKAEKQMKKIHTKVKSLQDELERTEDEAALLELAQRIDSLKVRYEDQKGKIQELKDKEALINNKIKELNILPVLEKGLGVGLASIAVIGVVVAIFFPPIGLGIVIGVTVASFSYFIGRVTLPLIIRGAKALIDKITPTPSPAASDLEPEPEPLLTPQNKLSTHQPEVQSTPVHSTTNMLHHLRGGKATVDKNKAEPEIPAQKNCASGDETTGRDKTTGTEQRTTSSPNRSKQAKYK